MNCELCIRHYELEIRADEVMADIKSAAWLEQELHPELDRHRRHQMADICEKDSVERVWRVLAVAVAELRREMVRILKTEYDQPLTNELTSPTEWRFSFLFQLPPATVGFLREKIHEYLVAAVMSERTAVIIPDCTHIWKQRGELILAEIRGVAVTAHPPRTRVRRPIWPM